MRFSIYDVPKSTRFSLRILFIKWSIHVALTFINHNWTKMMRSNDMGTKYNIDQVMTFVTTSQNVVKRKFKGNIRINDKSGFCFIRNRSKGFVSSYWLTNLSKSNDCLSSADRKVFIWHRRIIELNLLSSISWSRFSFSIKGKRKRKKLKLFENICYSPVFFFQTLRQLICTERISFFIITKKWRKKDSNNSHWVEKAKNKQTEIARK